MTSRKQGRLTSLRREKAQSIALRAAHLEVWEKLRRMAPGFISPSLPLCRSKNELPSVCQQRSATRRRAYVCRALHASATVSGRGGIPNMHDDPAEYDEFEQQWRRQNTTLVNVAQRDGIDAAVEMLWSLSRDGIAVTQNFNQVVSLLASRGRFEDGLGLAEEAGRRGMANIITFRPLMKRCCSYGDGRGAKRVWRAMSQYGIDGDMFLYAELMGALVRSQDMASAHKVVNSLQDAGRRPHVVLYNTLLKGYAKKADVVQAFEVIRTIEECGVRPDETVSTVHHQHSCAEQHI